MKAFRSPKDSLGNLDAEEAARLVAAASDIALALDAEGTIQDAAFQRVELPLEIRHTDQWLGRSWQATVTEESQPKVEALLREAATRATSRWREVSYEATRGAAIPIQFSVMSLGGSDRFIALGRDVRATAALQQKLVEAQIAIERDYARTRNMETRYRILFQMSAEPVLIVDANTQRVVEANPASSSLFGESAANLIGKTFPDSILFDDAAASDAIGLSIRSKNRFEGVRAKLEDNREFVVTGTFFRQDTSAFFLISFAPVANLVGVSLQPDSSSQLLSFVEHAPDAFLLTDRDGHLLRANATFLQLAQIDSEKQVHGESVDRWIGKSSVDFSVLISNLRQHRSLKLFSSVIRGDLGSTVDVEISAVVVGAEQENLGFAIRSVGQRLPSYGSSPPELPRSMEQLTELIGRVPLKELVRETTDVIERMCIEAALKLTGDNRAAASEMLGLSRQSLYVKLRRYGLVDASEPVDDQM